MIRKWKIKERTTGNYENPYAPIEQATIGDVVFVDDMGTLYMKWDNGRSLQFLRDEILAEENIECYPTCWLQSCHDK